MTGYTHELVDKNLSFKDWVLRCSRATGYLITMRDEPMDAEIPDEFKPSSYDLDSQKEAESKLKELESMSDEEKDRRAKLEHEEEIRYYKEAIQEKNKVMAKLTAMLNATHMWQPPTTEHQGLKDFMIQQLEDSIKHESPTYYRERLQKIENRVPNGKAWWQEEMKTALDDIDYHKKHYAEEVERCRVRSEWVQALKKDLKKYA